MAQKNESVAKARLNNDDKRTVVEKVASLVKMHVLNGYSVSIDADCSDDTFLQKPLAVDAY